MKCAGRVLCVLLLVLVGRVVEAQGINNTITHNNNNNRNRNRTRTVRYMVVQCKDASGNLTFEVIDSERLRDRQKECDEVFKELARDWIAGYKTAKKHGEKYTEPKPQKPTVERCRYAKSSYKTEEEAQKFADKIQAAYEKKMEERRQKEAEKRGEGLDDFGGGDDKGEKKDGDKKEKD